MADILPLSIAGAAMECGSQEILCQLLDALIANEEVARRATEIAAKLGEDATGAWGRFAKFLQGYGQTIVGALGLSFGIYRWWRYRERILHKRLSEYIGSRDARLKNARLEVLETVQRPAPGQTFQAPLFIDRDLQSVLREREWGNTVLALTVASSAEWQLSKAIDRIVRKLQTAEKEAAHLRGELCTAFSLRGAVASTRMGSDQCSIALGHFRTALDYCGSADVQIKELEAHQLRKLGHYDAALEAYKHVVELANAVERRRDGNVTKSRAKRYMAEIESIRAPGNAYQMLTCERENSSFWPGAIPLLEACLPLTEWELAEKGDMHYFAAFLGWRLKYPQAAPAHLVMAGTAYQNALLGLRAKGWWRTRSTKRLRMHIMDGRKRVAEAQNDSVYDTDWLPKLKEAQ